MNQNLPEPSQKKWIPDGFHFLGPEDSKDRRILLETVSGILKKKGYSEVFLPAFDYSSTFLRTISAPDSSSLFRIRDLSGNELSPSIDLTVQAVKGMAGFSHQRENQNIFYIGRIFRENAKGSASRKETLQIGAESIGVSGKENTFKILEELNEIATVLSLEDKLTLVLGNVNLFHSIVREFELSPSEIEILSTLLYQKNVNEIERIFGEKKNHLIRLLSALVLNFDLNSLKNSLKIASLSKDLQKNLNSVLEDTSWIFQSWESKKRKIDLCIDFSLLRDLNYYTGFVFQGYLQGSPDPVLTGGTYDHLYEMFSGIQREASGYALVVNTLEASLRAPLSES
ncbi:ATP phosphoribosyltransferase regulatory subunit [Leptospira santarosai]|uniref:Histidine--tRNA ligase n=1 Tax=Leptospira santarosai serovar Arenal str. MAVJ 401 TaxID=1049976 RepID=M6K426_9LEPT|nr:ATP phosphoribosyltransferase regulatory subunit [Leptospira santarosai]EMN22482.1 histidine--tRNA ligase [Leptospira santarosai serovar Arenal str. MAVJ 401]EMO30833.1 histidine--tRNA ligase [Leptospira santarosai str. HAI821]MDI7190145.1 ATP phosphoribosyltransferase regulatory subunit [Leptospira santarosai]MDI7207221.1 ATP phosphoribosyltransferase regulatory subunit [Leptospira santarosai]MDI7211585.1 ATP phosphoribosyltransferase regulatory subunit [Leptospira santarosai]